MRLFAIDVSGGITAETLEAVVSDIEKRGHPLDFVCTFTTEVMSETCVGSLRSQRLRSGGGTLFQPVVDWADKHDCGQGELVIYSDGFMCDSHVIDCKNLTIKVILIGELPATPAAVKRGCPQAEIIATL
jgi:predicted metal-dependent peptidase